MPGVFPDCPASVIRNTEAETEMTLMRWGMPPPPCTGGPPVSNIRNTSSPHWRGWLKPENRCSARLTVHNDRTSRNCIMFMPRSRLVPVAWPKLHSFPGENCLPLLTKNQNWAAKSSTSDKKLHSFPGAG
jgi:hypothetical protein